jgi:hypothetical protein
MLPEIELSEKNVEYPSNRKKDVELARNIPILVSLETNNKEKCSSKGVEHQSFTCTSEFTIMTVSKKKSRQRNQSLSAFYYVIVECFTLIVLHRQIFDNARFLFHEGILSDRARRDRQ